MGNCMGCEAANTRGKDDVEVVVLQSPLATAPPPAATTKAKSTRTATTNRNGNGKAAAKTKGQQPGDSFVDVLFFPDPGMPCKNFRSEKGCTRKNCKSIHDEGSSLLTMLSYLNNAKKSMEICVFTITCDEIADTVLAAHERGVNVRVITDDDQSKGRGSDIQKFIDAFCVIDNKILLNGSFNWSRQAVVGNAENLVIHAGGPIVRRFKDQFEKLWKQYELNART
uniref:Mitochondrial cardiolipin hydrolase n=1 Tax=Globisporangium ultimum (strain ATCC 200006 / CBS 805.95 / DAOM BR144) TaxID=431595 RepID=K3WAH2_GLOUD